MNYLAIEAYKVKMVKNSAYGLRNSIHSHITSIQTALFGIHSIKVLEAKMSELIPAVIKALR